MNDNDTESKVAMFFVRHNGTMLRQLLFDDSKDEIGEDTAADEAQAKEVQVVSGGPKETAQDITSIAVAAAAEDEGYAFYQASATRLAQHDIIRHADVKQGIPTSVGGDIRAYTRSAAVPKAIQGRLKIGLVDKEHIDRMDTETRGRFVGRLAEVTMKAMPHLQDDTIKNEVETLSSQFGLGIGWQAMAGYENYWAGTERNTWNTNWHNSTLTMQQRLQAGLNYSQSYHMTASVYNRHIYGQTLLELCKYLGVGN